MKNITKAQIINIAGKKHILGRDSRFKTTAAEYHAIKQGIASRRKIRRFEKAV